MSTLKPHRLAPCVEFQRIKPTRKPCWIQPLFPWKPTESWNPRFMETTVHLWNDDIVYVQLPYYSDLRQH